ncbi:MAG: histidine--tRNA ligase [Candidatus Saccharibacteria bacterium]
MSLSTTPYKGARDFYPEDMQTQNYIFSLWREVAKSFGYVEYNAPIIEPIELYLSKTSEEIINEQTYAFEDRGGRKVTLRPEMTPTVSRMIAGKRQELAYPVRWFSIPNLWRYERPQKGRLREHWQLNMDLFGVKGVEADHELIYIADSIMQRFGAQRDMYTICINSRKLINYILQGILKLDKEQCQKTIRLIDKMHKMETDNFTALLKNVCGDKTEELICILSCQTLQALPDDVKLNDSYKEIHNLEMMLARNGVTNADFDITLMRGFDYYTDIVFEVFDANPENNRSIFGGGRYDGLIGQFDVEPVPTVGFGMGDVTFHEFLNSHKLLPDIKYDVDINVILIGDVYQPAQVVVKQLREGGLSVAIDSTKRKMDKQIQSAVKAGYPFVLFIGEQELEAGQFNLKELATGQEQKLTIEQIIDTIKS